MKTRRSVIGTGSSGVLALLLAAQLGSLDVVGKEAPKAVKKPVAVQKQAPQAGAVAQGKKASSQESGEDLGLGDPFKFSDSLGGDLSPLVGNKQVGAIEIKGIINVEGDKPRALLFLKETGRMYYVSKGDVIRVSAKARQGMLPMEAYIVVKDVREEEVELIQQERPDKVIIIR